MRVAATYERLVYCLAANLILARVQALQRTPPYGRSGLRSDLLRALIWLGVPRGTPFSLVLQEAQTGALGFRCL